MDGYRPIILGDGARRVECSERTARQAGTACVHVRWAPGSRLADHAAGVDGYISGGPEGRLTAGAYERFEDLNVEWAEIRDRLQEILDR